jgi:hypothetical protein
MYRLRRWLEHHIVAKVGSPEPGGTACQVPIRLNGYCVEAVRRICLCGALDRGARFEKPVLAFQFTALNRMSSPTVL